MPRKSKGYSKSDYKWFVCRIKIFSQEKIIGHYYSSPDVVGEISQFYYPKAKFGKVIKLFIPYALFFQGKNIHFREWIESEPYLYYFYSNSDSIEIIDPIPERQMEVFMKSIEKKREGILRNAGEIISGSNVIIIKGPFNGYSGRIISINKDRCKVRLPGKLSPVLSLSVFDVKLIGKS